MSAAFDKLRSKLAELFQLDAAAELDFGIYRILNARRIEVESFLDNLQPQVDAILSDALQTGTSELKAELEKVEAGLRGGGFDEAMIATAPKVHELRDKIAAAGGDPTALAHDIFSHLTTFFSRYYKDGDFLSLRRYKRDTYAIPYEGEEVKLHWANADQFYIKSAENFRDYTFLLGPAPKDDSKPDTRPSVTFKLVEADTEKENAKAAPGQERRFVYDGVVSHEATHLILGFEYRVVSGEEEKNDGTDQSGEGGAETEAKKKKKKKLDQKMLNAQAIQSVLRDHAKGVFTELASVVATKANPSRTMLEKHLTDYTARNTFDYFIHKDLGGFLRRELDFYIKNEVLHLDDLDDAPEANWRETRAQLKALRTIAGKVTRFLAQIEDFQKKLWLKKKFVTACDYVVTLDRIPEELYPEIATCEAQREEWVRLFAIDEIKSDLGRTGYYTPLTVQFLKENQGLTIDTRHFAAEFRQKVVSNIENEGAAVGGKVIQSDNLQALALIQAAASKQTRIAYVDPPYNRLNDDFLYKDTFKHSSWASMMRDRLVLIRELLTRDGSCFVSIDENEITHLRFLMEMVFGPENFLADIIWQGSSKNDQKYLSICHEYIAVALRDKQFTDAQPERWLERKEGLDEIYAAFERIKTKHPSDYAAQTAALKAWFSALKEGHPSKQWSHYSQVEKRGIYFPDNISKPAKGYFYDVRHPVTGKACKPPKGGYRFIETTMEEELANDNIHFGVDETKVPCRKSFLRETEFMSPKSVVYQDGRAATGHIRDLFGDKDVFPNPKDKNVLARFFKIAGKLDSLILDPVAGSGTTAHAILDLNREDGGNRKYILIEMGEHFDTVLVPRLKKVIYSKDWKDGKPQSRNTGVSHCLKVLRLESYEDTLNNLRLHRSRDQELALESMTDEAREDYQLGYMLDLEAAGSQSLLNVSAFTDPFSYTLNIATGTAGETKPVTVDLVETFNWLLGLTVLAQGGSATSGKGGGVTWVEGSNPEGEKVIVLWRNLKEVDADALNAWCKKQKISVLDGEFALIYVNGDHHLENLRRDDQTWKVRLTDEEFPKLMWEGCL